MLKKICHTQNAVEICVALAAPGDKSQLGGETRLLHPQDELRAASLSKGVFSARLEEADRVTLLHARVLSESSLSATATTIGSLAGQLVRAAAHGQLPGLSKLVNRTHHAVEKANAASGPLFIEQTTIDGSANVVTDQFLLSPSKCEHHGEQKSLAGSTPPDPQQIKDYLASFQI